MTPFLFVYGTLQPGAQSDLGARERTRLKADGVFLGPALAQGILLDLGGYPGMMQGAGSVHGGIYKLHVPESVFAWLDLYEGINGTPNDEYCRREIEVTREGGAQISAYAYLILKTSDAIPAIPSGRWNASSL